MSQGSNQEAKTQANHRSGQNILNLKLTKLISQLRQQNRRLSSELINQRGKNKGQQINQNSQKSLKKVIEQLERQQKEKLQKNRIFAQQSHNRLKNQFKKQINAIQTNLEERYKKEWQLKVKNKDTKISQLQAEIDKLKIQQLEYNNICQFKNKLLIQQNLLKQSQNRNKKITDDLILQQKQFQTQHNENKIKTQKSLNQFKKVNQNLEAQLQKVKENVNKKYIQKIGSLQLSQKACLQIISLVVQLQKAFQNLEVKNKFKVISGQINQLLRQQNIDEAQRKSLGSNLKIVLNNVSSHIRQLEIYKAQIRQQSQNKQQQLKKQIAALEAKRIEIDTRLQEALSKIQRSQKDIQMGRNQLSKISDQKKMTQQQNLLKMKQLQNKITQMQNNYSYEMRIKNDQITQLKRNITQLQKTNSGLLSDISLKTTKIKSIQAQLGNTKMTYSKLQEEYKKLQSDNKKLGDQINYLKKQIIQLEKKIRQKDNQIKRQKEQIQKMRLNIAELHKQISKLKDDIEKLKNQHKQQINNLNNQINSHKNNIKQLINQNNQALSVISERQSTIRQLRHFENFCYQFNKSFISELAFYISNEKMSLKFDSLDNVKQAYKHFINLYKQVKFFASSEVIQKSQVNFVIDSITKFTQRQVEETKLIYHFDPKNTTNFHQYIDNKQNLVILVKNIHNYVIGGYSQRAIQKTEKEKAINMGVGKGILFSVTKEQVFHVKKQASMGIMSYDDFFFIFGNSEIRIRDKQKKIFSLFGVSSSTFNSLGWKKVDFLGEENNEIGLITYEFYQIKFRQ